MEERQKTLFNTIFKEYIKTGAPVGSTILVDKFNLDYSSATVRNEMMLLEKEGYLFQPHISAGRIPTEKGYRYYLANFLEVKELTAKERELIDKLIKKHKADQQEMIKSMAKLLAELSQRAIFLSFGTTATYYTGISNLFLQPEFQRIKIIKNVSEMIDQLDEVVQELSGELGEETRILLGRENPFGLECGTVVAKYGTSNNQGVFGVLSPMRLDYCRTLGLINYVTKSISED